MVRAVTELGEVKRQLLAADLNVTVSASHLPQHFAEELLAICAYPRSGIVFGGYYGLLVFARGEHPDYPGGVQDLLRYALADLDCSFVLFDCDGDVLDGFETYDAHDEPGTLAAAAAPAQE